MAYSFCIAHSAPLQQVERCISQEIEILLISLKQYAIPKAINEKSTSIAPSSNDKIISVSWDG